MKPILTISTIAMIALAYLAPADEPEAKPAAEPAAEAANGEVDKQLEKQAMGYWAPDAEAIVKHLTEEKGMKKEEAQALADDFSKLAIHAEMGTVHLYTDQGLVSTPYEILEADKDAATLTLRAKNPAGVAKAQPVEISIKEDQITVLGGEVPFILKKIDEEEFRKRKDALPAEPVKP